MKRIAAPCLILLLSLVHNAGFAQKRKAVLVKLSSEQNRILHFERKGDHENANYVREDAKKIMDVTIGDFEANFHYCNVYYFIDTNLNEVLSSNFTGILLDKELKPATDIVLHKDDTSFLIVYYGIPDDVQVEKKEGLVYRSGGYPDKGLVVLRHDYTRDKWLDHFIYWNHPFRKSAKQFVYYSKKFDIEYKPWARELQENMQGYRNNKKSSR